jgi:CubicO group peptidase (beta-lactamase class C family)
MNVRPEAVGFSSTRLAHLDDHLRHKYIDTGRLPCAMTLIERRGQLAHLSMLGHMDIGRDRPLQSDTIFRIYSMSKPITSVAFMMLVEEGRVALDEPVHRYIPEWRDLQVYEAGFIGTFRTRPVERPMMIIDLLRHTSGLTYGFQQRTNVDAAYRKLGIGELATSGTLDSMIAGLSKLPLEHSPGAAWNYSVATDVLGYLVGKISGISFEQFLRERIFEPLHMLDTDFHVPADKASRLAACYATGPERRLTMQDDPETSSYLAPPSFVSGGAGLVSTIHDYQKFCRMLLNGGTYNETQFLSPKTIELMTANHLPGGKDLTQLSVSMFSEASYAGIGFGLGFATTMDVARSMIPGSVGEYSWGGAASTYFWIDPREELFVIFMTQFMPSSTYPLRRELRTLVYSAMQSGR